jgi:CBS domain-containing protein
MNQAMMVNPRNCYQRYNAAINSTSSILHTYMGTLLPNRRNVNFAGAGEISPLTNDPNLEAVGVGSRIFLCGAQGMVIGEGTQSSPGTGFATIAVKGNLKEMSKKYLAGATVPGYGASLFIGIGIPIPVLNERIAKNTAIRNESIKVDVLDYGVPRRVRPSLAKVSYEELFSGKVEVGGRKVRTSSLSSLKKSVEIMDVLREWMTEKRFFLSEPVEKLPADSVPNPMKMSRKVPLVREIMTRKVITGSPEDSIDKVANILVSREIDQVPIIDERNRVVGIVTSWDITKAIATGKKKLKDIMTRSVITATEDEYIDAVARRVDKNRINATPVVDKEGKLIGILTVSDIIRSGVGKPKAGVKK